jgi:hypothetical protein
MTQQKLTREQEIELAYQQHQQAQKREKDADWDKIDADSKKVFDE